MTRRSKMGNKNKRTLATVQQDLTMTQGISPRHGFIGCRYSPFQNHDMKVYIPDGRGKNVATFDYKLNYDITTTAASYIRLKPTYPYVGYVSSSANVTVNGLTLPTSTTSLVPGLACPLPGLTMTNSYPGWNTLDTRLQVSSGRFVTVGFKLTYTGPALNASGLVTVTDVPWAVDTTPALNATTLTGYSAPLAAAFVLTANSALAARFDEPAIGTTFATQEQFVSRPEVGAYGILKKQANSDAQVYQPYFESSFNYVSDNVLPNAAAQATQIGPDIALAQLAGIQLMDPAFCQKDIYITAAGSYRLEVLACIEMQFQPQSNFVPLTTPTSPKAPEVLKMDDALNATLKAAVPLSSQNVVDTAKAVSTIVGAAKGQADALKQAGVKPPAQKPPAPKPAPVIKGRPPKPKGR